MCSNRVSERWFDYTTSLRSEEKHTVFLQRKYNSYNSISTTVNSKLTAMIRNIYGYKTYNHAVFAGFLPGFISVHGCFYFLIRDKILLPKQHLLIHSHNGWGGTSLRNARQYRGFTSAAVQSRFSRCHSFNGELQILYRALQKSVVSKQGLTHMPKASQHGADNCNHVFSDEHDFIQNLGYTFRYNLDVFLEFLDLEIVDACKNCSTKSHSSLRMGQWSKSLNLLL